MMKINTILISVGIIIILILSVINTTSITTTTPTNSPLLLDQYPALDTEKKVKHGSSGWVDEIQVPIGTIVRFNISVIYHDINLSDSCRTISKINIIDHLGNFEYKDNISCSSPTINPDDYLNYNHSTNTYTWKFDHNLILSETSYSYKSVFYLEFDAKVNYAGSFRNYVEVNGTESCCGRYAYSEAYAFVNVSEPENPAVNLTKYVKKNTDWVKSTSVNICDTVYFKLLIQNTGNVVLNNVNVTDDLPAFLSINNDSNIQPEIFSNHHIEWRLGTLAVDQTVELIFSANATASGEANNHAIVVTDEGATDHDAAHIIVMSQGYLRCTQSIWNPDLQQWVGQINADLEDTVRFNITLTYSGTGNLSNIKIVDTLPICLEYANNANRAETGKSNNIFFWNLSDILSNGQSVSIEFDSLVIASGNSINIANITGTENCCTPLYCEDTATVIVEATLSDLECEKKVWDPDTKQWVEQINVDVGDIVRFNITLTYNGNGTFLDIHVKDILPGCLQYANNASLVETGKNNTVIFWNLSNILTDGQSVSIEFDALAISSGTNSNTVNITGYERCIYLLSCEDTATVIIAKLPLQCEKKVWDQDMKQWVEEIDAEVGDTVRFKITVSYWDSLAFYNIWINDTLPTCLQYNNNATPFNPVINGKEISWYLVFYLKYGQNVSLEFDALIISDGKNINMVNVSGWKCGIQRLFCEDTATVFVEKQPDPLVADAGGPYSGYVSESIQMIGSATGGISPYSYTWDLNNDDVYDDAVGINPTHTWGAPGIYTIRLKVTDTRAINDTDIAQVTVEIRNTPPNTPSIPEGSESGRTKRVLTYSSNAIDPDGNMIFLLFDWGDGNTSGWLGPFTSGSSHEANHTWTVKGTYSVKVKAKDTQGEESLWSNPLTITITRSFSASYINVLENLSDRFPAMENLLTALLHILESMRLNHPLSL